jgi:hypothetical protein
VANVIPELIESCALGVGAMACLHLWWTLQRRFAGPFWMGVYLALPASVLAVEAAHGPAVIVDVGRWTAALGAIAITFALTRAIPRDIATLTAGAAEAELARQRAIVVALAEADRERMEATEAGLREARAILDDLACRRIDANA